MWSFPYWSSVGSLPYQLTSLFQHKDVMTAKYFPHYLLMGGENRIWINILMMTSSSGNIFRVTGPLYGNSPVTGEFPSQRPVTRSFDIFFDLSKRLSKQSTRRWFETPSRSLWRHSYDFLQCYITIQRCRSHFFGIQAMCHYLNQWWPSLRKRSSASMS